MIGKHMITSVCAMLFALSSWAQTTFYTKDLVGDWKCTAGYYIRVRQDDLAILSSVGETRFPAKLVGHTFYANITHDHDNVWTATFFQWVYDNGNMEDGRWENRGTVRLSLSDDKKTFTDGKRTFHRE